jgi:transcriptional repressor NrdR
MLTEVSSEKLGQMVMERLRKADAVSYVRFASVYKEFRDLETFLSELHTFIDRTEERK